LLLSPNNKALVCWNDDFIAFAFDDGSSFFYVKSLAFVVIIRTPLSLPKTIAFDACNLMLLFVWGCCCPEPSCL